MLRHYIKVREILNGVNAEERKKREKVLLPSYKILDAGVPHPGISFRTSLLNRSCITRPFTITIISSSMSGSSIFTVVIIAHVFIVGLLLLRLLALHAHMLRVV